MMRRDDKVWDTLYSLAPINQRKPMSTLYDVISRTKDLDTVKRFVAGGHEVNERFGGGHSVSLAVGKGDLEFVRYFVENSSDLESVHELLAAAGRRISEAVDQDLETAHDVFNYLLEQPFAAKQLASAYMACAAAGQFTAAKAIIDAGLEDHDIQVGHKEYTALSGRLVELGHAEFAALLKGDPVDTEEMLRKERKEQQRNARHKGVFDEATSIFDEETLEGQAFDECYQGLLTDIAEGRLGDELASRDSRFGRSVIEFAAANGLVELVRAILDIEPGSAKDAERNSRDAAVAAATWGHLDVLEILADKGVPVDATPKGSNSPLSEACRYGHYDAVCYLLELGADPESGDGSGHSTTLHDITGGELRNRIISALNAAVQR